MVSLASMSSAVLDSRFVCRSCRIRYSSARWRKLWVFLILILIISPEDCERTNEGTKKPTIAKHRSPRAAKKVGLRRFASFQRSGSRRVIRATTRARAGSSRT